MNIKPLTLLLACALAIGAMQSCTKKKDKKTYNLTLSTASKSIAIPATTYTTSSISYGPSTIPYDVDSFIKAQTSGTLNMGNITSARVLSIKFTITDTSMANNMSNFENMAAILATDRYTIPLTFAQNSISLNPDYTIDIPVDSNLELQNYFGNVFSYSVLGKLRKPTTADMHCHVNYVFRIKVEG